MSHRSLRAVVAVYRFEAAAHCHGGGREVLVVTFSELQVAALGGGIPLVVGHVELRIGALALVIGGAARDQQGGAGVGPLAGRSGDAGPCRRRRTARATGPLSLF